MKKIIGILVIMLLLATTLPVVGTMNIKTNKENVKQIESNTISKQNVQAPLLPPWILELFNGDWNYWSNTPDMFSIPTGNIGIGTSSPVSKLEVVGTVRITNPSDSTDYLQIDSRDEWTCISRTTNNAVIGQGIFLYSNGLVSVESLSAFLGVTIETLGMNVKQGDVLVQNGKIGIGTITPTSKLHVIGKATITGGVDPPYVSFSKESHASIREFAKNVEDHEEVMQFWNGDSHRMEIYDIREDVFYTLTGELIVE